MITVVSLDGPLVSSSSSRYVVKGGSSLATYNVTQKAAAFLPTPIPDSIEAQWVAYKDAKEVVKN